MVKGAWGTDGE